MKIINDKNRVKLIEEIQKLGNFWEASAEMTSMSAIRNPKDKNKQEEAARYILIYDTQREMATKIIDLVNGYWPREGINEKA